MTGLITYDEVTSCMMSQPGMIAAAQGQNCSNHFVQFTVWLRSLIGLQDTIKSDSGDADTHADLTLAELTCWLV